MQKLKLNIPKPCMENWDTMTPTEKGRHCQVCQTEVVDFTNLSDEEVLQFFTNRKLTPVCVNLTENQYQKGFPISTKRIQFPPFIRKIASISLIGITMAGTPILLNGQSIVKETKTDSIPRATDKIITIEVPATYQTYEVQKVKTPAKIIVHEIPAEYQDLPITRRAKYKGGFTEWRELELLVPENEITVEFKLLKQKLKEKGYFEGTIDNVLTEEFKMALVNFKKAHKLLPVFEVDDDTLYLLDIQ